MCNFISRLVKQPSQYNVMKETSIIIFPTCVISRLIKQPSQYNVMKETSIIIFPTCVISRLIKQLSQYNVMKETSIIIFPTCVILLVNWSNKYMYIQFIHVYMYSCTDVA